MLLTVSLESPGGVGRFMPMAKALAEMGHQVTVLALHHDYLHVQQRAFTSQGVRVRYVGQMHVRKSGDHKEYFGAPALLRITALGTLRLAWAAMRTPSDVLHVCKTQPMNGLAAWIVHILRRAPIYLDSDDYEAVNNRFSGAWQQRIVAWFEDWMPSFARAITANTTFIAERFAQLGFPPERIILVPNAVDRERFALLERPDLPQLLENLRREIGIAGDDRVVVYVGSMSSVSHALDLLLDAFGQVVQHEPRALLLLVGGGEDLPRLQQRVRDMKLEDRVKFLGRVPQDRVPLYYRLGEASVDPLEDTVPAQSSLSLKLVESLAAGVPCITTDVGDRSQTIGEAGIAVPPGDAQALAGAMCSVFREPEKAEAMRKAAARDRATHYWSHRIRQFLAIYEL
jgi:glycosyltransferase involved in cell wall biosynthesis